MPSQRIHAVEAPYSEELTKSFDVVMPKGMPPLAIFRTVGRNPRVLSRMVQGGLLDKGSISIADRELIILRACALCGAEYEWGVHVAGFSAKAGFSQDQIADTCSKTVDGSLWSKEQIHILEMVEELHDASTLTDQTWLSLKTYFEEEQLVEMLMLAGLYHAVSFVVNGLNIENEAFAPCFPQSNSLATPK